MNLWNLIVTIEAGAQPYRLSKNALSIEDSAEGKTYQYIEGLLRGEAPPITVNETTASIDVPKENLDITTLQSKGIRFQGATTEMALWRTGDDWRKRKILLNGKVLPNGVRRFKDFTQLEIGDFAEQSNRPFPPWTLTAEGFPSTPTNFLGQTMPVLYGQSSDVPMTQISSHTTATTFVRMLITGHRLGTNTVYVEPDGVSSLRFNLTVKNGRDHASGAGYSYVEIPQHLIEGYSGFTCTAAGHTNSTGNIISGLGNIVDHALRVYSGLDPDKLDEERMSRFRSRANRLSVASLFGGESESTLVGSLKSRYEENFSMVIGWRGGKLGADLLAMDYIAPIVRTVTLGKRLIERVDPVQLGTEEMPFSSFEVLYDPNPNVETGGGNISYRKLFKKDHTNDDRCKLAYSRWGSVPFPRRQTVDVNTLSGAKVMLDWLIDRYAVQRTRVSYLVKTDDFIQTPIYEYFGITDAEMNWTNEVFRLESIEPRDDDTSIVTFLSRAEAP